MKKYLFFFLFLSRLVLYGQQNITFEEKNFKDTLNEYYEVLDSMSVGDYIYKHTEVPLYYMAIPYYLDAEKFNPNNDELNYKLGVCMLSHNSPFKTSALQYLQKAFELNPDVAPDIHYQLGRAYHLNMDWEAAKKEYNAYLYTAYLLKADPNQAQNVSQIADVKKKIEECNDGEMLAEHPVRVSIENLGSSLNTIYPEYGALVSANESEMIFTSKRPDTTANNMDEVSGQYTEGIYVSFFKNGTWTPAANSQIFLSTAKNDATAGLSPDGQTLYVYRGDDGGDIYESHLKSDSSWTTPQRMNDKINSPYFETSATLSPDGKTLYVVSARPGGYGGRDIYKIVDDSSGTWGELQNLGPVINTPYNEEGISFSSDGKTLYFSSEGHNTMGGYDVFKSHYDSGRWSAPENMGYPINTPDDDVFFSISANGKHAYYSSIRKGGDGQTDIYRVTFLGPDTLSVDSSSLTLFKVLIQDSATHKPVAASVEITDNKTHAVVSRFKSNDAGRYHIKLPSDTGYKITVSAQGYRSYSASITVPGASKNRRVEEGNIFLKYLGAENGIVLSNVLFDFNKATLREKSMDELNMLVNMLETHSDLKIEISGYTDNTGPAGYNMRLSVRRAKAVVNYLVAHHVNSNRLSYKGYGLNDPIATNDTKKGRQLNRRTEFKIAGK